LNAGQNLGFETQKFATVGHFGIPAGGEVLAIPTIDLTKKRGRCRHGGWIDAGCHIISKNCSLQGAQVAISKFLTLQLTCGCQESLAMNTSTPLEIDPRIYALYDEYCHGAMDRREFLAKASALAVGGMAMAQALFPRYANAQTISFTDSRIKANYVKYASPGGTSGEMRGYLVQPTSPTPVKFPAVLVIHENRGLNPYIEDVARRLAAAGFLALAPDGLYPVGGYPGNDEEGKLLQDKLNPAQLQTDMLNSAVFLQNHGLSNGKLGVTGFCWGGGMTSEIAAALGDGVQAGAPYYGIAPSAEKVRKIKAELVLHFADKDPRINASWPAYEASLKTQTAVFQAYQYEGTQHGFHDNSTPRFQQAAADLSWRRTLALFQRTLKT
jgi:carboxymethylenebutenolidase